MMKNNLMPRLCGFIISLILATTIFGVTRGISYDFVNRIRFLTLFIVVIWGVLLATSKGFKTYKFFEYALFFAMFVSIGLYLIGMWHRGYITNIPFAALNSESGGIHRDTLYHSAIASGIQYYGYPSLLVNSADFHNYHFGSHLIMGLISKIINIPALFTYCYVFPMIFFPLLPSLFLSVGEELKIHFKSNNKINVLDGLLLLSFLCFFVLPENISGIVGNPKIQYFLSESFCVAFVIGLTYVKIWFTLLYTNALKKRSINYLFWCAVTPLFVVATTISKVSVGAVFTFIVAYTLLRKKGFNIKYLILEGFYTIVMLATYFIPGLFYSPIISGSSLNQIHTFDPFFFLRNFIGGEGGWGLFVIVFFCFVNVFLFYRLRNIQSVSDLISKIKNNELIPEELMFLVCVVCILPTPFIGASDEFYFLAIVKVVAVVLLIGFNIPAEIYSKISNKLSYRSVFFILLAYLSFSFYFTVRYGYFTCFKEDYRMASLQCSEIAKENSYWSVINEINTITDGNKKDYYLYVSPSANIWKKYDNRDCALFFYPATTGVVCIGELYFEDGQLYYNDGTPKYGFYYYEPKVKDTKMTEEDAFNKAKEDGKKAIIYIYEDTMSVKYVN